MIRKSFGSGDKKIIDFSFETLEDQAKNYIEKRERKNRELISNKLEVETLEHAAKILTKEKALKTIHQKLIMLADLKLNKQTLVNQIQLSIRTKIDDLLSCFRYLNSDLPETSNLKDFYK